MSFTMCGATGVILQHHQILRLPRISFTFLVHIYIYILALHYDYEYIKHDIMIYIVLLYKSPCAHNFMTLEVKPWRWWDLCHRALWFDWERDALTCLQVRIVGFLVCYVICKLTLEERLPGMTNRESTRSTFFTDKNAFPRHRPKLLSSSSFASRSFPLTISYDCFFRFCFLLPSPAPGGCNGRWLKLLRL